MRSDEMRACRRHPIFDTPRPSERRLEISMNTLAPPLLADTWFNSSTSVTLEGLRGKVVVVYAFQMLCPGCVSHALPQAQRVRETFSPEAVAVIGLHTVFEHHAANSAEALKAFLHEYRIDFPVGIDRPSADGPLPETMKAYAMRGTPTVLIIDRDGRLRHQHFGHPPDLQLGAEIMAAVGQARTAAPSAAAREAEAAGCADGTCVAPVEAR